ncbi:uncharacterized protein LOC103929603 [Pyrus x bretschneideri]|uniref:uncharacterized protein LOC103929603 n=1 Tax=Pyrus x bretschneideri TaxID=225117 RepID=UPI00202FE2A2|nr:uncharacterized protein LOC103929603 [Pyrus x bretschneideri]
MVGLLDLLTGSLTRPTRRIYKSRDPRPPSGRSLKLSRENQGKKARAKMAGNAWAYVRIISGTILGGILGFYVMDRAEKSYKEKVQERLRKYEIEMKKREKLDEFEESQ